LAQIGKEKSQPIDLLKQSITNLHGIS